MECQERLWAGRNYHGSLATSPVPPSRPVGCARMAREHHMLWSGQMVLEEASSSDTNLDTPVESCPSLSPESPFLCTSCTEDIFLPFPAGMPGPSC